MVPNKIGFLGFSGFSGFQKYKMYRNYPRFFFFTEITISQKTCLGTTQGMIRKDKYKGYLNMNLQSCVTNVEYVWMSLKITSSFYIPGKTTTWNASTDMHNSFGLALACLTSRQRPFWSHGSPEGLKIMTLIQNFPHPRWFVPRIFCCSECPPPNLHVQLNCLNYPLNSSEKVTCGKKH